MTKEDAIEYLEKLYMIADFTDEYGDMDDTEPYDTAVDMAIEALQSQATLDDVSNAYENGYRQGKFEAQQWIPCSDHLPKESGTYFVTAYDGHCKRTSFMKYQKKYQRWDLTGTRTYWQIMAWMPLPGSWEGEEHENNKNRDATKEADSL